MAGTLFVVATPIGNLEDLTFRALRTLKEVDLIAAEDTRRTAKLLAHYQIQKPMVSLREHNEARASVTLVAQLAAGKSIALVTDAGTPGIADPGAVLVRRAREHGIPLVPIPGASAVTTALSVSGFSGDQFVFLGFPPASGVARDAWFVELKAEPRIAVFYEAPHRIDRTLEALYSIERPILVLKELTKIHELFVFRPNTGSFSIFPAIGEFVIVVGPLPDQTSGTSEAMLDRAFNLYQRLSDGSPFGHDEALDMIASHLDVDRNECRKMIKKRKILVKRQNDDQP